MAALRVRLFGSCEFFVDGKASAPPPTAKARALTGYLLALRGKPVARERLADIFWPDSDGDRARSSVGTALWSIRRALRDGGLNPEAYLRADTSAVSWQGETESDVAAFEEVAESDPHRAAVLYGGAYLEGVYDEWTVAERERLAALYESVLERTLGTGSASLERGALALREAAARRLLDNNPYVEAAWATLVDGELERGLFGRARATLARALRRFDEGGIAVTTDFRNRFRTLAEGSQERLRLPFVGRDDDVARVLDGLRDERAAGGIAVVGQAGMGKSELLQHVARMIEAAGSRVVWIVPRHQRFDLGALEEIAGFPAPDAPDAASGGKPKSRAAAIAAALLSVSDAVYVVDDFHYADGDVREVLLALAAERARAVVGTRPEGREALQSVALGDIVEIGALDRTSVLAALREAGLSALDCERAYDVARGFPFALEALLRAGAAGSFAGVPDVARALLERRLDERGALTARVAGVLALEQMLEADEIARVLSIAPETVLGAIDDLFELGILRDGKAGVEFSHDLFVEVAIARMTQPRRRALHVRIADSFQGQREPARLAHHLAKARRPLEAARAYLAAAQARFTAGAFFDAGTLLEAGLAAVGTLAGEDAADVRISLRIEFARALADAGKQNEAVLILRHGIAEARTARRDDLLLRALLVRNRFGIEMGAERGGETSDAELSEAIALAERTPASLSTVQALGLAARGLMNRDLGGADRYAAAALSIARRLGDAPALAEALQASATIALVKWDVERAIAETAEFAHVASRVGAVRASRANGLHGVTLLLAQRYDEAETFGRKALALAAEPFADDDLLRVSRWRLEMLALELLTFAALQRGASAEAVAWAERRYALETDSAGDRCEAATVLTIALFGQLRPPAAAIERAADVLAPFAGDQVDLARSYMLRTAQAMLAVARGDAEARTLVAEAWERCLAVPAEEMLTLDYWLVPLARAARRSQRRDVAEAALTLAREIVRRRRAGSGARWLPSERSATRLPVQTSENALTAI